MLIEKHRGAVRPHPSSERTHRTPGRANSDHGLTPQADLSPHVHAVLGRRCAGRDDVVRGVCRSAFVLVGETTSDSPFDELSRASDVALGHALSGGRHDRMSSMAIRYTEPAGGRSRYCVYLVASGEHCDGDLVVLAMDFRPAANAYPPEPRPVLVVVVDEDGRRPCSFDVIEPAQLPRALGFVIDRAGDPAIDDGEADRHQADHPAAADRAQAGDSCPLQCAFDPGLVHRSIIAAPIGVPVRPRPKSVVTSNVSSRYMVVLESWLCPRPAQGLTGAAMPLGRGAGG